MTASASAAGVRATETEKAAAEEEEEEEEGGICDDAAPSDTRTTPRAAPFREGTGLQRETKASAAFWHVARSVATTRGGES